ncbi:MAG: NAD-dependent epimerase/dehydratase family protein [Chitinispirillaceae bacterium]|nr:NAD-dependent epimerase/dehydratase family protein [Chitinispirillaceae bacterium]
MNNGGRILITGGTGAMGSVLTKKLVELGYTVRLLALPGDAGAARLAWENVELRYGDVASADQCAGLCDGVQTVLHLAAIIITPDEALYTSVNAGGTRNMVRAAEAAGVSHFIHVSSASVVYPKPTPYSISKRVAEKYVTESRLSWTIVRPTLVYGKRGGQEFDMFLRYLNRFPVVPFIGDGTSLKRPVYVDDVVDGMLKLAIMPEGRRTVYNFSGGSVISMMDFARLCLSLSGKEYRTIVRIPVWLCRTIAFVLRRIMHDPPLKWSVIAGITQDANLDPQQAIRELGYSPAGVERMLPRSFPRV